MITIHYLGSELTPLDFIHMTGDGGMLSLAVFLAALVYAGSIFSMRLGLQYRIAFVPLALLPFFLGICEFLIRFGDPSAFHHIGFLPFSDGAPIIAEFLAVVLLTTVESGILLVIAGVLFLVGRDAPPSPVPNGEVSCG